MSRENITSSGHRNDCDLVGYQQGYPAPDRCSCDYDERIKQSSSPLESRRADPPIPEGYYLAKKHPKRVRPEFYAEPDEVRADPPEAREIEPTFCRACGASIPHRYGEGRCDVCAHHDPAYVLPGLREQIAERERRANEAMLKAREEGDEDGESYEEGRMSAFGHVLALLDLSHPAAKEPTR